MSVVMKKNFWNEKHTAVITGASAGIGAEFARQLFEAGHRVILCGRDENALRALSDELCGAPYIIADLSRVSGCRALFEKACEYGPDIFINNAGFGIFDKFSESSLEREIELINTDVRAVHILFKLFLGYFEKNGSGYILNTASIAGFMPGPMMSGYYASKAYVIRQTQAVWAECLLSRSPVRVSVLCPGPVQTGFNERAGITGTIKGITAKECVSYTLEKMKSFSPVIVPSVTAKAVVVGSKLTPALLAALACYVVQKTKKRIGSEKQA